MHYLDAAHNVRVLQHAHGSCLPPQLAHPVQIAQRPLVNDLHGLDPAHGIRGGVGKSEPALAQRFIQATIPDLRASARLFVHVQPQLWESIVQLVHRPPKHAAGGLTLTLLLQAFYLHTEFPVEAPHELLFHFEDCRLSRLATPHTELHGEFEVRRTPRGGQHVVEAAGQELLLRPHAVAQVQRRPATEEHADHRRSILSGPRTLARRGATHGCQRVGRPENQHDGGSEGLEENLWCTIIVQGALDMPLPAPSHLDNFLDRYLRHLDAQGGRAEIHGLRSDIEGHGDGVGGGGGRGGAAELLADRWQHGLRLARGHRVICSARLASSGNHTPPSAVLVRVPGGDRREGDRPVMFLILGQLRLNSEGLRLLLLLLLLFLLLLLLLLQLLLLLLDECTPRKKVILGQRRAVQLLSWAARRMGRAAQASGEANGGGCSHAGPAAVCTRTGVREPPCTWQQLLSTLWAAVPAIVG
mmetsp:Transcript_56223/g.182475  ORF Transcript_56223/g.182475 Transcript_56223/m.182475 type:complete len:471 (-) Transcript_56223:317-1729(-)